MTAVMAQDSEVVSLNNDGVRALNKSDYVSAIKKFELALKLNASYKLARANLSIAYNNFALEQRNNPQAALKLFHKAVLLDPANTTTKQNVDGIIRMMGLDPKSFDDRVKLGDKAYKEGEFPGAIVEYAAALDIRDSAEVRENLGDVYCLVDRKDKAIEQFEAALKTKYRIGLDKKLRELRSNDEFSERLTENRSARSFSLNNPMIALVAFPLLALLLAFVTRKKRISIWFIGLAIASIFAVAGFFAL
jgi:hypothetical protein